MQRKMIIAGAILGMLSVIIGAWAAHGINNFIPDIDSEKVKKITSFKVGVRYQFYHSFFLLFLGLIPSNYVKPVLNWIFRLTLVGVLMFSGSIYLLSLKSQLGLEGATGILGPITPIGGLTLIVAWAILVVYALKLKKD